MARPRRIVLYAVNGSGLGHVTRLLAVARWLRRYATFLDGGLPEILFLTSTEATGLLAEAGFPAFKLPSKTVVRHSGLDVPEYRRLARHFVWHTLGVFQPDLLVVDTFPAGSFDELFQLLDGPFRKAFIFREVKPEYGNRPIFQAARGLYDTVVAPHRAPSPNGDPLPGSAATGRPVQYCGEVLQLEREEARPRVEVRQELGLAPGVRLLFLSAGGGGDPGAEEVLTGLVEALRDDPGLHLLVGAGPLYRGRRPGGPRVTWSSEPGLARLFAACDGAISAGGYNTFHELLFFGVPTLFFAQDKIADDQQRRIATAVAAGACRQLAAPREGAAVRREVASLLQPEVGASLAAAARQFIGDNGARRCAACLLEPLYGEAAVAGAVALLSPRLVISLEQGRTPAESALLLGGLLTRLLPPGQAGALPAPAEHLREWLQARLSPGAAAEVAQVLGQAPEQEPRVALEQEFLRLLQVAGQVGLEPARLVGLVEAALKKHPLTQEPDRHPLRWATRLLAGLGGLLGTARDAAELDELLLVYRIFPRLHDCDAATALALFGELGDCWCSRGRAWRDLQQPLQALKLLHRQPGRAQLAELLAGNGR
ncbi:MAG: hypothetical protein RBU45_11275 [Myxococcota bacterium]|jgi:predicted glycosyltransferase|nr:hypothetical protein [Myxococcota bacterium]